MKNRFVFDERFNKGQRAKIEGSWSKAPLSLIVPYKGEVKTYPHLTVAPAPSQYQRNVRVSYDNILLRPPRAEKYILECQGLLEATDRGFLLKDSSLGSIEIDFFEGEALVCIPRPVPVPKTGLLARFAIDQSKLEIKTTLPKWPGHLIQNR